MRQAAREAKARALAVTPELLRSAFRDAAARSLLAQARVARLAQDSSLTSYDANTYERFSLGLNLSRFMSERLLFRTERATHVLWRRDRGAQVTITGARSASPVVSDGNTNVNADGPTTIPYFPGSDALWVGSGLAKTNVDAAGIVNPLAQGAEAYYTYATGDSLTLTLPTRTMVVRELRVLPRSPSPQVVVGSLWFEVSTGHLVRAIYRMAGVQNVDIETDDNASDPGVLAKVLQRLFTPSLTAQITAVTVDYGLFEGRFWLPTSQTGDGQVTVGSIRVPVHLRQHFEYGSVNGTVEVPTIAVSVGDTAHTLDAYLQRQQSARNACADTSAEHVRVRARYGGTLPVMVRIPCDSVALAKSTTLPASIYDPVDTLFDEKSRADLVDNTFGFGREASFVPQKPGVHYGFGYTRYNRIEGFSTAVELRQLYAPGLAGHLLVRGGFADRSVNGELGVTRSNGPSALSANVYRRLNAADDWGNPFGLAASIGALFGHDDQTYYRSWGGELVHQQKEGLLNEWRLFGQHEFTADQRAGFAIGHDDPFHFNTPAVEGNVAGLAVRRSGTLGEDPAHFRALSDLRVEGVTGTFDYVRAMADLTFDQPLAHSLRTVLAVSGGTSGGTLPIQHHWFLGGPSCCRLARRV